MSDGKGGALGGEDCGEVLIEGGGRHLILDLVDESRRGKR